MQQHSRGTAKLIRTRSRGHGAALLLLPGSLRTAPLAGKPLGSSPALPQGFVATSGLEGAWVGTWRPHRPRGPIMAQFPSPGPKYSIPGTTAGALSQAFLPGLPGSQPPEATAPAYTFRRAKPPVADSCSPGPRYYVQPSVTGHGKRGSSAAHGRAAQDQDPWAEYHVSSPSLGPGTHTLPRLVGPNTARTRASP
ncbi:ciliary microtubule associated protein 1A [Theristicus caerulescens]